ncbi:hypothetical protein SERLADRAFT_457757 [Serpula lacrymans var. lacrymans S7.9]|uniref:Uncharacterized protein n=1 Tax=Serpula lacrymans var. lacrymans (strain S7.9) TaxID=578457 RepID=F8NH91_SERL9|nr:uncharacterized protein SERLADRAFT_457757 [Serpula lacrymans var. lacrymans S7.9]EGO29680.1 hypothetical protein SERLADRAFT_457757 [Serpula lacrymans var. lacrymans S7.9]
MSTISAQRTTSTREHDGGGTNKAFIRVNQTNFGFYKKATGRIHEVLVMSGRSSGVDAKLKSCF